MLKWLKYTSGIVLAALTILPNIAFADKSDDTIVVAFSRELTNLDYNFGTKTEYIILGDLVDDSLFYVEPKP